MPVGIPVFRELSPDSHPAGGGGKLIREAYSKATVPSNGHFV